MFIVTVFLEDDLSFDYIAIYFDDLKQLYKHIAVGRLGNDMKQFPLFFSEIRLGYYISGI